MKLRHYTIIATLALLAASCAHEESEVAQISDIQLAITAAFATPAADFAAAGVGVGDESSTENPAKSATKATTTAFESGDLLGLYAVKSGGELNAASNLINNHQLKVAQSGAIVGDLLPAYYPDKSSSLDLFSYYPYQSGNATADALGVLVGIRTTQTDFSSLQASDLCYGRKLDAAPSAAPHPLQFHHSFAQLRLNFSLYEGCSAISAVKLLAIKDSAKLNLQTGVVTLLTSSVADVEPFVGSLSNSADATNPLQFTAIIPAQSLSGACVEITLTDGTIYYYHATTPIALKESATNTLNLNLSDKGKLTLASTPAITAWGVEPTISNISESTDNAFTFYWSPAITSFASINKAFVTLTNPATKKSARIEVAAFVRDATSTAANAIFRFAITRTDAASIGYPVTIDKFELFNGGTAVHTLTDYYGRTVTRSGAHTFGTVTSIKLAPDGDWLGAANTAQSRSVTIATTGSTSWVASASPSGIGLSVSPASGANSATATISWAAQLTTGDSPLRSGTVTFTTVPDGVSYVVSTSQLMGPYYLAVNPATAWANVANTAQSRSHAIATGNLAGWTATATSTPTAGLTVTASGTSTNGIATPAIATWAAQAVGALARSGSVTITPNPATVGGVATAAPITITTNQLAGPAPTMTLALTDAIDNPIPAGGKSYKATITSNHAWTASALTNVTLDKTSGAAGATMVVVTVAATTSATARAASVVFTTDAVPSKATASQTWSGSQAAASIVLEPAGDWANVANSWQQRVIKVTTYGIGTWGATARDNSGANALSVTASGNSGGSASIVWLAQAVGALARAGTVTFSSGSATPITINTNQLAGAAPAVWLSANNPGVTIPNTGGQYTFTVNSNINWTAPTPLNSTLSAYNGGSGASVTIYIPPTNVIGTRSVTANFNTIGVASGAVANAQWNGTQAATTFWINPAGDWWNAASTAVNRAITPYVGGALGWNAVASNTTGLSVYPTSGASGAGSAIYWADNNAVGSVARSGSVTYSIGGNLPITVNTSQNAGPAPTLTLSGYAPGVTVPKAGGTYYATVYSNTSWWSSGTNATITPNSGSGNVNVTISIPATSQSTARNVSAGFATHAGASGAVASQTWSGTQESAVPANAVRINNLWWSTINVGATTPQGYGNYYAWTAAPAACTSLGAGWRLPNKDEFGTVSQYGAWTQLGGINGRWFGPTSGWSSSNAIFFPAAGLRYNGSLVTVGAGGNYWSSTENSSTGAYNLYFGSSGVGPQSSGDKTHEFTVRCVQ